MNKILVVDDETSNIDVLCHILRPEYDVIVAKNGRSAMEKTIKHKPDLILLDVIMPDISGFEVIADLKQSELTRSIPVIFITGLDNIENEEKGLLLGAVDYITKPFINSIVKARVRIQLQLVEYINTIERMCKVDALTNIANRRHLDSQIAIEWSRAMRDKKPVGFLMVDIDHFKNYNDTYGHPQGDALLKAVAAVFQQSLNRPADLVARWGGEEFAALLPDTDLKGALEVAERIRANVEHTNVPCADGALTSVTVSIGVNSEIPLDDRNAEDFISQADKALYIAKSTGRNRIQSASTTGTESVG